MSIRFSNLIAQTPRIQSKLPTVGTTIFTVMSARAAEKKAINLSQGFPDFNLDPLLRELVAEAIYDGFNQYAPMAGYLPLREFLSNDINESYGLRYEPETEITITSGATEALFAAITTVIQQGDEVIVFDPCYDSYVPAIEVNGGIPVFVPLRYPDYGIDWELVKKLVNRRTRAIIINSPHNPCGTTLSSADMQVLNDITKNNNIFIISDEVYEHIVFDGITHQSIALYPELAARSFKIGSFGKSLHVTGWKVGYCVAPAAMMAEFRKVHQYVTFCTSAPFQVAIHRYITQNPDCFKELSRFYQAKRDAFRAMMESSRFEPLNCSGSYFQLYSYKKIADISDTDFVNMLIDEHGVAGIPISVLFSKKTDNRVIRFCFAKRPETLELAAERLCEV